MKAFQIQYTMAQNTRNLMRCLLLFIPATAIMIFVCSLLKKNSVFFFLFTLLTGWLIWGFAEYLMHRFWMHNFIKNTEHKMYKRHMDHHHHPTEIKITAVQRIISVALCLGLVVISIRLNNYFTLAAGFFTGFVLYTYMHVILHKRWASKIFRRMQEFHIHHHCKHPDKCFGVTIPWWDYVFNTYPKQDAQISLRIREFYFAGYQH